MDDKAYRQLKAWQHAMEAYDAICQISRDFPADERYGLVQQIRRAALSVPSNIAEGYGRHHRREYLHHLYMARGSLMEVETQLIAAVRQQMCNREAAVPVWSALQETGKTLHGLIAALERSPSEPDPRSLNPEP